MPETGVQRHAREVVRALDGILSSDSALAGQLDLEIVAPPGAAADRLDAIRVRCVGRVGGHMWEQTVLPRHAVGGLLSFCNTGPVRHRKHVVCIHDTNTRNCPESYSAAFRALYRVLLPALGRTAVAVTTVSHHSAAEIARCGIRGAAGITVVPNGHEHVARWRPAHSAATRAVATRDTIVVLGSPAPHKNLALILGLAVQLKSAGLRIAVVGAADPRVFRSAVACDADNVVWLGRRSDPELAAMFRDCLCLAFPSLTEGFGMPPLEAMALGCPVVVSDRSSIPEVCGDAALYAAPDQPEAWLRHVLDLKASPALRQTLAERGLAQAGRFRWRDAAERYLAIMERADGAADSGEVWAMAS